MSPGCPLSEQKHQGLPVFVIPSIDKSWRALKTLQRTVEAKEWSAAFLLTTGFKTQTYVLLVLFT
jgi:hypothetical protein